MKYTGPKFKLCRREGINLFGPAKYDVRNRRGIPGQHKTEMARLSEYGKLLRNKQVLKRMYLMSEKQFAKLVNEIASKYAKNKSLNHEEVLVQFLERRCDAVLLRSGFAKTIMQARQMITHGHFLLNGQKHNIPSSFLNPGDILQVSDKIKKSNLYQGLVPPATQASWLNTDRTSHKIQLLDHPRTDEVKLPVDVLKVIEFYARA